MNRPLLSAVILCAIGLGANLGCARGEKVSLPATTHPESNTLPQSDFGVPQSLIHVVDKNGQAVANAQVLIGAKVNTPFPGNLVNTNGNGDFVIPAQWTSPQPLTIDAAGFIRATFFATAPGTATFTLTRDTSGASYEVGGVTEGFGDLSDDGWVDVGVVFQPMTRSQVASANIERLISPENDKLDVFGQDIAIPSNISVPKQTESYILPVELKKPTYRIYFDESGSKTVAAAHVRFPFKEIVDGARNHVPLVELLNKFEFISLTRKPVQISNARTPMNVAVGELPLGGGVSVKAPNYPQGFAMLSGAMFQEAGLYYFSDVKYLQPGESRTLKIPSKSAGDALILHLMSRSKKALNLSGGTPEEFASVTTHVANNMSFNFLPIVAKPNITGTSLALTPPTTVSGVEPLLTRAVLSRIEKIEKNRNKLEKKIPQWELYTSGWATGLDLPEFPKPIQKTAAMRWEVLFGGSLGAVNSAPIAGPQALEKVSHVTHNAIDF